MALSHSQTRATSYDKLGFCVLHFIYKTILLEFYGKNNLEAARIDQILDTLQDLMTASIPYLAESKQDKAKKVITNDCPLLCSSIVPRRDKHFVACVVYNQRSRSAYST